MDMHMSGCSVGIPEQQLVRHSEQQCTAPQLPQPERVELTQLQAEQLPRPHILAAPLVTALPLPTLRPATTRTPKLQCMGSHNYSKERECIHSLWVITDVIVDYLSSTLYSNHEPGDTEF